MPGATHPTRARRRMPPPSWPASFPPQVAVLGMGGQPYVAQPAGQFLGDRHAAVLPTGTAHRHGQVPLALALEAGCGRVDEPGVRLHERDSAPLPEDVTADLGLPSGVVA